MPKQYSIADARHHLPAIVHDVERGTSIELTRRGKPVAVLISIARWQRLSKGRPDFWKALQEFRRTHDLEALNAEEVFSNLRDRSPGREVKW